MPNLPLPSLDPEEWLIERFVHVAESNPRYESSWYGLHIALLSHYFPYQQKFLIKPQPKVRDTYEEDFSFASDQAETSLSSDILNNLDDVNVVCDVSITSTGALAFPGLTYRIPDFTVAKATRFATHDRLFLLVEVKCQEPEDSKDWTLFGDKMDEYMEVASLHLEQGAGLIGLLICGTVVEVSRLENPGSRIVTDKERYDVNSLPVRQLLHGLATENWDW